MKVVLILEDDRRVLDLLCLILASRGYTAVPAITAEEALQLGARCYPAVDLLIADIVLPFSSGIQTGLQLREQIPRLKILLISGYPVDAWRDHDRADLQQLPSNMFAVLQKPFLPDTLLESVEHLIGSAADPAAPLQKHNGGGEC